MTRGFCARALRGAGLIVISCATACSTDAGGPRSLTIGVRVTDAQGEDEAVTCVRLPVLLGSRVEELTEVPAGFQIRVTATRDHAIVDFPGALESGVMRVTDEQVEVGYADQTPIVDPASGTHTGYLFTGCKQVFTDTDE